MKGQNESALRKRSSTWRRICRRSLQSRTAFYAADLQIDSDCVYMCPYIYNNDEKGWTICGANASVFLGPTPPIFTTQASNQDLPCP